MASITNAPLPGSADAVRITCPAGPQVPRAAHRADRLLELEPELFGHHARWMSEPAPFLGDLDAIYRRRWTVPAS